MLISACGTHLLLPACSSGPRSVLRSWASAAPLLLTWPSFVGPLSPLPPTHVCTELPLAMQVDEVCDTIVAQLARFAAVLAPGPKGAAALGESGKACLALEAMFSVANRWVHGSVVWKGVPGKGLPGKGVGEHIRLASQA